jgi:hypothetical protein
MGHLPPLTEALMAGRSTTLTPALTRQLCATVKGGAPLSTAAAQVGISADTVREWRQRGEGRHPTRKPTPLFWQFAEALRRAEAAAEVRHVKVIETVAQGGQLISETTIETPRKDGGVMVRTERRFQPPDWRASAFWLQRRRPQEWGRRREGVDLEWARRQVERLTRELATRYGLDPKALLEQSEAMAAAFETEYWAEHQGHDEGL